MEIKSDKSGRISLVTTLIALGIVVLMTASIFAESKIAERNSDDAETSVDNVVDESVERTLTLELGETEDVGDLVLRLDEISLLKSDPPVRQATISYGLKPEGVEKPLGTVKVLEGEKRLIGVRGYLFSVKEISDKEVILLVVKKSTEIIPPSNSDPVRVYLNPVRQVSDTGKASYEVTVKDLHEGVCVDYVPPYAGYCVTGPFTYTLLFESKDSTGTFSESELTLELGEKKSVKLVVEADKKGSHTFVVIVGSKEEHIDDVVKGVLVYGGYIDQEPAAYFIGDGFAVNNDGIHGKLVKLRILNQKEGLKGTMHFGNKPYRIEGALSDTESSVIEGTATVRGIEFTIYSKNSDEKVGSFTGNVKKFDNFLLLEGDLTMVDICDKTDYYCADVVTSNKWTLTAISKRKDFISVVEVGSEGETSEETIAIDETVTVTKESSSESLSGEDTESALEKSKDDLYIRPIKVKKEKFLWIFPSGKKVVEVEIIKGDKIVKKTIKEESTKRIEGYDVSVGSLDNEESIEINVEKAN